jgi:hypothetical protein
MLRAKWQGENNNSPGTGYLKSVLIHIYIVEGASLSANMRAILLDSNKTGRDPNEIIHDSSGKVSLTEKQVLMDMWKGYGRRQTQTNTSDKTIERQLWLNSSIVYNECFESKGEL